MIKPGDRRTDQGAQTPSVAVPDRGGDQGVQTPTTPVRRRNHVVPSGAFDHGLRDDLSALQRELKEEKELNAKCHADLLALLQALQPKPLAS